MNLSRRALYALLAMIDLATATGEARVQLREIAARQHIPEKYLEQLLRLLKTSGLVLSTRGSRGGYTLSRPAADITVLEVLEAVEGPFTAEDEDAPNSAGASVIYVLWDDILTAVRERLGALSVGDLARRYRQRTATGDDWVI